MVLEGFSCKAETVNSSISGGKCLAVGITLSTRSIPGRFNTNYISHFFCQRIRVFLLMGNKCNIYRQHDVNGLKYFPETADTVFPRTQGETCIPHLVRYSLSFWSWKDRQKLANVIKAIYRAQTQEVTWTNLIGFEGDMGFRVSNDQPIRGQKLGTGEPSSFLALTRHNNPKFQC